MELEENLSDYFDQVHVEIYLRGDHDLVMMDVKFLRLFCLCLETWDFNSDEESRERLRSMLSALEVIWAKQHNGLSILNRLRKAKVEDLHSLNFELEGKIQQSKLQIQGWCGNLLRSLIQFQWQCKPFAIDYEIIRLLDDNLDEFSSYIAAEENVNVPLEKQIGMLRGMIVFLKESLEIETKNHLEFINFAHAFFNNAACLTCLYWAKEGIEETEMNIVLFDMMQHQVIPCAPDVIVCYFSNEHLQPSDSDPILLSKTVAKFVDFFFEHLATTTTTLKDDFIIFRDWMICLFSFLAYHPHEKLLIRSQIYALFRKDAYLLLPLDVIKEDFFNKKMLLSDFKIKIETTFAMITQHHLGFSNSSIGLEAGKLYFLTFVSVQRELYSIIQMFAWGYSRQLELYGMELRFLRASLLWFATWDDSDEETRLRLSSMIVSLQGIWGREEEDEKGFLAARLYAIRRGGDITDLHPLLAFELEEKIQLSKLEIETWLVNWFHSSLPCKPSTSNKIHKFLCSFLDNLNDLVNFRAGEIVPFKKQIETLQDKLVFLRNLLKLTENCKHTKELGEFHMFVQDFASDAACLTLMYWAKEANDIIATEINLMLSHMLQKIKPAQPDVARLYFETFKAIYLERSDSFLFGQTATTFVDFVFDDPADGFQILRDDVIFLLSFLNDPPNGDAEKLICNQIDNHFWEGVYGLLPIDDMKGDFSGKKVLLSDFMMKIGSLNDKIRKLYCQFLDSSMYNLPNIMAPRYLDFLIQKLTNLKERMITDSNCVPFAKYKIKKIEQELVSLSPLFNYILKLQKELNDTWLQAVDLLHLTERVINSCISSWFVFDHPIWYYMAHLFDVIDKIKVVRISLEKIKENNIYNARCLPYYSSGFMGTLERKAWVSKIKQVIVGFEDEAKEIIDNLTRGHKSLDIVSIVGMGGSGKTTLAKKVIGSSLVKDHFHISAFYTVSLYNITRMLLLGILRDITKVDDEVSRMTDDELAHKLWQCLSRRKYLIVLDDIWNISVWDKIKRSLPDDQNGSRVMLTTRSHEVANACKIQCNPLHLRFLSKVESWELLQKVVFQNGISPPNLFNIGRLIAASCKGLPLAIAVIAGLLVRKERSESSWKEIAENLVSYLYDEGCMNILELSYSHLPEYLKPCLLYLGAYPEDALIRVKQVILLWIAEGFIQESETKSIEDVAKEYFNDLVERSLIIVNVSSSIGDIKAFSVHDLIHDMCQRKCHEGNFFKLGRGVAASSSRDHYRISDVAFPSSLSSSFRNASTLLIFRDGEVDDFLMSALKLTQVLYVENISNGRHLQELTSLVNLRYLEVGFNFEWMPSSISNLWNIQSLILIGIGIQHLPESLWNMKSLRHVNVRSCKLQFSDGHEQLDKVVSFSTPIQFTGKDVEWLLQRLPAVRKLRIEMSGNQGVETLLDFYRKLESLNLSVDRHYMLMGQCSYLINFPSTLKKLTLIGLQLPLTTMSAIAELHCLRVLKLHDNSFTGPIFEMEDVSFNHLVFFQLYDSKLVQWNASTESFPCLEQLWIECPLLEELPPCFGEISTLKMIHVIDSPKVADSAHRVREEQMDLGKKVEVIIPIHFNALKVAIETIYVAIQTFIHTLLLYSMTGFQWRVDKFFFMFYDFVFMCFVYFSLYGMMLVALTPYFSLCYLNFITRSQMGDKTSPVQVPGLGDIPVNEYLKVFLGYEYDFLGVVAVVHLAWALLFCFVFTYGINVNFQRR